jgi:type II secretory pathway component PulM
MQEMARDFPNMPPPPSPNGESLLVIIDRSAREANLAGSLSGSEPHGPNALSLRLEKANFETLITWLARLAQQNGVTVDSATIEKAGGPGQVNAAIVLHAG